MTESVLPTDAVEAAQACLFQQCECHGSTTIVRAVLEAALPFLREQWEAELEQVGWFVQSDDCFVGMDYQDTYLGGCEPVFVHRQDTET